MKKLNAIQKMSKIMPFLNQIEWKGINFSSELNYWNNFLKTTQQLNVFIVENNDEKEIKHTYISK